MKVEIITRRELQNPHLELDINLETGLARVLIRHTCPKCSGYGCRHSGDGCDDIITLAPEDVLATLGLEAKPILERLLRTILIGRP